MSSVVTELIQQGYPIRVINVRHQPQLAVQYRVRRVPTFVYESHGKEVRRLSGSCTAAALKMLCRRPLF